MWLNAKFTQAGAYGSPQIMQPPVLFEGDRLIERNLGPRPVGKAAPSHTENKISIAAPRDPLKDGKGAISERHTMFHPVLGSLFRYGYCPGLNIDLGPPQTADFRATTADQH
jgi:hypothetical protein